MTRQDIAELMHRTFVRLDKLREAGQKEYAHKEENSFANFERVAGYLSVPREKVLWTYVQKHLDGIVAHLNGHRSQRESVHGRIDDVHVYLELLRGMLVEDGEPEYVVGGCPFYRTGESTRRYLCKLSEGHEGDHIIDMPLI